MISILRYKRQEPSRGSLVDSKGLGKSSVPFGDTAFIVDSQPKGLEVLRAQGTT
jgi:hypothetical protein